MRRDQRSCAKPRGADCAGAGKAKRRTTEQLQAETRMEGTADERSHDTSGRSCESGLDLRLSAESRAKSCWSFCQEELFRGREKLYDSGATGREKGRKQALRTAEMCFGDREYKTPACLPRERDCGKIRTVKGLSVELFSHRARKNSTRPLTVRIVGTDEIYIAL